MVESGVRGVQQVKTSFLSNNSSEFSINHNLVLHQEIQSKDEVCLKVGTNDGI